MLGTLATETFAQFQRPVKRYNRKSLSLSNYIFFQDAEILLSIIASTLKGKRGNDSDIENLDLTMEDFNRVERLVLEDMKSRSWPILQSDTFNM